MKTVNYDKDIKELFVILICLVIMVGYVSFIKFTYKSESNDNSNNGGNSDIVVNVDSFNEGFVKAVANNREGNYLVSPYSVGISLSMLSKGANGNTLEEINKVIGDYSFNNISSKDRIGIANALFAKDMYKNYVIKDFSSSLVNNYGTDIIYDKFEAPDKINTWCKENTWNMIDKVMDNIDSDFAFGIANAVAIDVEWEKSFECNETSSQEFTKLDNSKISVEMMHNTYSSGASYFEDNNSKGVVIPYKKYDKDGKESEDGSNLEFVGILPNDSVTSYLNNLASNSLNSIGSNFIEASDSKNINLSLPRFKYDFDLTNFKEVLQDIGINDAFSSDSADFTGILSKDDMSSLGVGNLFVSTAIHKTHIDLNEKGTKAAVVTMIALDKNTAVSEKPESFDITFDKSFIYMIRDKNTKEILFFGVVDSPNVWNGSTCSNIR